MKNLSFIFILFSLILGLNVKSSAQDKSSMDTLYVSETSALSHSYRERMTVGIKPEKKHFKGWTDSRRESNPAISKKPYREGESGSAKMIVDSAEEAKR